MLFPCLLGHPCNLYTNAACLTESADCAAARSAADVLTAAAGTAYGSPAEILTDEFQDGGFMPIVRTRTEPAAAEVFVLNYNGRRLLDECLASVVRSAEVSRFACRVTVIDNASTDESVAWVAGRFPQVRILPKDNRGLCSFNPAVAESDAAAAVLLNNDIKLDPSCLDRLLEPLLRVDRPSDCRCFMTAPLCWLFDGQTYEGLKTAVRWRWGLVQATARFPGHEPGIHNAGLTASAGAALAVDREKFLEMGGFDPLFLPGRLEDLDFCFRGFQAGYHARYVPEAVAYHRGFGTFHDSFGRSGCDLLALRNTMLFQWKNLRHPVHWLRQALGLPVRIGRDVLTAAWVEQPRRFLFIRALHDALRRVGRISHSSNDSPGTTSREREFFRQFHPEVMAL